MDVCLWFNWMARRFYSLGESYVRNKKYEHLDFFKLKKILKTHDIKTLEEFRNFRKKNTNLKIPYSPDRKYTKYWKGWPDFLGKK